jgi:chromosome segregation ATPase
MLMTDLDPSSQISHDSLSIRERGIASAREYSRVVETFDRVLSYKETFRRSIESQLASIGQKVKNNIENLETLMRNIDIYNQNIDKISNNLGQLQTEEDSIKARYEQFLNGSGETPHLGDEGNAVDLDSVGYREYLIQRRRSYLESLDQSFKHLDGELFAIEKLRAELERARGEILVKKDEAKKQMEMLEEAGARYLEDVKHKEKELESSMDEEKLLINGFNDLVNDAEKTLEISDEIDHILFTYLTPVETNDNTSINPVTTND